MNTKSELIKEWKLARSEFQYFALKSIYDKNGHPITVINEESNFCVKMINYYYDKYNKLQTQIINS